MSEILERIRSGGHWRVLIRPANFERERVTSVDELFIYLKEHLSVSGVVLFLLYEVTGSLLLIITLHMRKKMIGSLNCGAFTKVASSFSILPLLKTG